MKKLLAALLITVFSGSVMADMVLINRTPEEIARQAEERRLSSLYTRYRTEWYQNNPEGKAYYNTQKAKNDAVYAEYWQYYAQQREDNKDYLSYEKWRDENNKELDIYRK